MKIIFLILVLPLNLYALEISPIDQSRDRNFNGIFRGMGVFQDVLTKDYGAVNEKGLIEITGDLEPKELVSEVFTTYHGNVVADFKVNARSTILDRGYINDGARNPRIPKKLQKIIDLYNSQIMGLANGSKIYRLIVFSIDQSNTSNKKGWILINKTYSQALYAAAEHD